MPKRVRANEISQFIDASKVYNVQEITLKRHDNSVIVVPAEECPAELVKKFFLKSARNPFLPSYEIRKFLSFNPITKRVLIAWHGRNPITGKGWENSEEPVRNIVGDLETLKEFAETIPADHEIILLREINRQLAKRIKIVKRRADDALTIASLEYDRSSNSSASGSRFRETSVSGSSISSTSYSSEYSVATQNRDLFLEEDFGH